MKKKIIIAILSAATLLTILAVFLIVKPVIDEKTGRARVYEELQIHLEELSPSVVGVLPRVERPDGFVEYGGGGSGVIFAREGDCWYAFTAAHVVSNPDARYKVYTVDTECETVDDTGLQELGIEVMENDFYDKLADVTVEYISPTADLAVISFRSGDALQVAALREEAPKKGERIVCLGHPEGRSMTVSYGNVGCGPETVAIYDKETRSRKNDTVYYHDAYLNYGSSGGPAFDGELRVLGLNTGGSFSLFGRFRRGFLIPADQLRACIAAWQAETGQ